MFQSLGDQHITQVTLRFSDLLPGQRNAIEQCADAEQLRSGSQSVVNTLLGMVAMLNADCSLLEKKAKRARAEGRAEALEEIQGRLRDYELKLMQTHEKLREAHRERERAELLLAEANRAAEEYRRAAQAAEQDRQSELDGTADLPEPRDLNTYNRVMETVEGDLGVLRDELRRLSDEMSHRLGEDSNTAVVGEVVASSLNHESLQLSRPASPEQHAPPRPEGNWSVATPALQLPPQAKALPSAADENGKADSTQSRTVPRGPSVAGRSRVGLLVTVLVCLCPPIPVLIAGTSIRLIYSARPGPAVIWSLLFTVGASLAGALLAAAVLAVGQSLAGADGDARLAGCTLYTLIGIGFFAYSLISSPGSSGALVTIARYVATAFGPL